MNDTYAMAYTEVLELLKHLSKEEYTKIPKEKIEFYETNRDKNYQFTINPEIDLREQHISTKANAIIISLFRDYFATERQKETLENLLNQNQEKLEEKKRKTYNPDNIFENVKRKVTEDKATTSEMQLVEYKETFFSKVIGFVKRILKIS